jgi:excisionase family DNA binding protein
MTKVYSVAQAAERIGVCQQRVRRLLAEGRLKGQKLGHDWVVLSLWYERKRKPKTKRGGQSDATERNGQEGLPKGIHAQKEGRSNRV